MSGGTDRTARRVFTDRREAGRVLSQHLSRLRRRDDVVVLALARGGVPVGWEVAHDLHAPLEVFLVRKLGVPQWRELAMGAIASGGGVVVNDRLIASLEITEADLAHTIERETAELHRREAAYRGDRPMIAVEGATAVLVDDGIATGASMLAAVRAVRALHPARIVVAVPVGPASVCRELRADADEVVCATTPAHFEAVGQVFADFHQISDDEVRDLLATPTR